jgi:hypothetical protein
VPARTMSCVSRAAFQGVHAWHFSSCTREKPAARSVPATVEIAITKLRAQAWDVAHVGTECLGANGRHGHAWMQNQPGTKCVTHPNTHAHTHTHTHTHSLSVPLTNNCSSRLRARPKERFLLGKKFFLALTGQWPAETVHPLSAQKLLLPQVKLDELIKFIKTNSWTLESCHFDGLKFCSVLNNREPFDC